jgi:hypothetical protein
MSKIVEYEGGGARDNEEEGAGFHINHYIQRGANGRWVGALEMRLRYTFGWVESQ